RNVPDHQCQPRTARRARPATAQQYRQSATAAVGGSLYRSTCRGGAPWGRLLSRLWSVKPAARRDPLFEPDPLNVLSLLSKNDTTRPATLTQRAGDWLHWAPPARSVEARLVNLSPGSPGGLATCWESDSACLRDSCG